MSATQMSPHGSPQVKQMNRQAEIEDLGVSRRRNENTRRFDVAMDDPFRVCGIQAVRNLNRQFENLIRAERPPLNAVLERLAFQELHRDEVPAFALDS